MRPTYEQLCQIYDAVSDPIILMAVEPDAQLRIVSVNAAFCRLMRLGAELVVGKLFRDAFPRQSEDAPYFGNCLLAVREQRVVRWIEHTEFRGQRISADIKLTPIVTEGRCTHLLSVSRDITEETIALEASRAQLEYAPEAIITYDFAAGGIVEVNARACELFEGTRAELFASRPADLSPERQPDGCNSIEAGRAQLAKARLGEVTTFEWVHKTRTGRLFPCEVRLVLLPGSQRMRGSIVDITDRKQAEELKRLSAGLIDEKRVAEAGSRVKSELVANLSHELRTPLNAILGFAEIMHDGRVGALSDEQRACLADILGSGRHLLGLITGMLDLSKAEAGRMAMKPERIAIRPLVAEATELVRSLAAQKEIVVDTVIDPALTDVIVDGARLKQVMLNYLSNALKFTDEGGRVVVRVRAEERQFCVEVEDTGVGIREDDIPKLFVEFTQLESGLGKRHEGTGLGLALTKRIVELQGGSVGVDSVIGKGSTFWARLPRGLADAG